jgi:uncharacterized protein YkwD
MSIWDWWHNFWHPTPTPPTPLPTPPPNIPFPGPTPVPNSLIIEVFNEINRFRTNHGRSALKIDKGLMRQAQNHSVDMANEQRIDHDGFAARIEAVHPNTRAAENVEYNQYLTAADIVRQWVNSPPHLKNLLGDYDLIGICLL